MRRRLPVVTRPDCSRREVVTGLGVAAAASFLGHGCSDDTTQQPPDVDSGVQGDGTSMCGADLCLDLAHPANAGLASIGGLRAFVMPKRIVVIRSAATTFTTLSRVCTHQGCTVLHNPMMNSLNCPCHGSRFALDGAVLLGPALAPLAKHTTTFDEAAQTVTIVLSL